MIYLGNDTYDHPTYNIDNIISPQSLIEEYYNYCDLYPMGSEEYPKTFESDIEFPNGETVKAGEPTGFKNIKDFYNWLDSHFVVYYWDRIQVNKNTAKNQLIWIPSLNEIGYNDQYESAPTDKTWEYYRNNPSLKKEATQHLNEYADYYKPDRHNDEYTGDGTFVYSYWKTYAPWRLSDATLTPFNFKYAEQNDSVYDQGLLIVTGDEVYMERIPTETDNGWMIEKRPGKSYPLVTSSIFHIGWNDADAGFVPATNLMAYTPIKLSDDGIYDIAYEEIRTVYETQLTEPMATDVKPITGKIQLDGNFPDSCIPNVYVTANGFDDVPTWKDVTSDVARHATFQFPKDNKTADQYGIDVRVTVKQADVSDEDSAENININNMLVHWTTH